MAWYNFFQNRIPYGWNRIWRRLFFEDYDPGAYETSLSERLDGTEYDPRLQERNGVIIFERMAREDSRLATVLQLLKEPIKACTWSIEASEDRVKMFVEDNLGLSNTPTTKVRWAQILKEMLTAQEIGFAAHEITYELREGMEYLRAVGFRPQISINKFEDDGDYLTGLYQITKMHPQELVYIPASQLMYTAYNRIGTDFWGKSLIRPAYRDWYFKDKLLIISMLNLKRFGIPVPWAQHSDRVSKKARDEMDKYLQALSADERSSLITGSESKDNPDWLFRFFEPERPRQIENLPLLGYYDDNLAKVALVLFLDLGSVSSGNRALGDTFADILFNSLKARCETTTDTVNEQLLPGLVEKNFGPGHYARMTYANLELHNMERFIEALARFGEVWPLPLTREQITRIMRILKAPDFPEEMWDKILTDGLLEPDRPATPENMPGVGSGSGNAK